MGGAGEGADASGAMCKRMLSEVIVEAVRIGSPGFGAHDVLIEA